MRASGVWRLCETPRRKSSFSASRAREPLVLGLDAPEQLGVAERDGDARGEQLQEVLVGRLPARGRGRVADEHAGHLAAAAQVGADRPRLAGDALLVLDRARIAQDDPGVGQAEALAGVGGGALQERRRAFAGRPRVMDVDRPGHLPVAPREVGGQLLLALREPAELVVGERRERVHPLAGRDPVERDRRASRSGRARPPRRASPPTARPSERGADDAEQDQGGGSGAAAVADQQDARRRRPAAIAATMTASVIRAPRLLPLTIAARRPAGSRCRGPSRGGAGWFGSTSSFSRRRRIVTQT